MAGKNRRTKKNDLTESSDDSGHDETQIRTQKLKERSYVRREKERELKKTKSVLSNLCDSEEDSDESEVKALKPALPVANMRNTSKKAYFFDSEVSSTDEELSNVKSTKSKSDRTKRTKIKPSRNSKVNSSVVSSQKPKRNKSDSSSESESEPVKTIKTKPTANKKVTPPTKSKVNSSAVISQKPKRNRSDSPSASDLDVVKTTENKPFGNKKVISSKKSKVNSSVISSQRPKKSKSDSSCSESELETAKSTKALTKNSKKELNKKKVTSVKSSNKNSFTKTADNKVGKIKRSDSSSSKEFQPPKHNKLKLSHPALSTIQDYSIVPTPTKSDDENIAVEKKQEITFKHHIIQEVEKLQKLTEEMKSELEIQSDYLIQKKIGVVRDSKFIVHKILRMYDSTHEKLKCSRNEFANTYKSWMDACCSKKLPAVNNSISQRYNLSFHDSENSNDEQENGAKTEDQSDSVSPKKLKKKKNELNNSTKSKKNFEKFSEESDDSEEDLLSKSDSTKKVKKTTDKLEDAESSEKDVKSNEKVKGMKKSSDESGDLSDLELNKSKTNIAKKDRTSKSIKKSSDKSDSKDAQEKKKKNLNLTNQKSKESSKTRSFVDQAFPSSDSVASSPEKQVSQKNVSKEKESRKYRLSTASNGSIKSRKDKTHDKHCKRSDEDDSVGQVSDCDSEKIFSEDESRPKKKDKSKVDEEKDEAMEIDAAEEVPNDVPEETPNDLPEEPSNQLNNTNPNNSDDDIFNSTCSEIANTPSRSPILGSRNKSLRKALLTAPRLSTLSQDSANDSFEPRTGRSVYLPETQDNSMSFDENSEANDPLQITAEDPAAAAAVDVDKVGTEENLSLELHLQTESEELLKSPTGTGDDRAAKINKDRRKSSSSIDSGGSKLSKTGSIRRKTTSAIEDKLPDISESRDKMAELLGTDEPPSPENEDVEQAPKCPEKSASPAQQREKSVSPAPPREKSASPAASREKSLSPARSRDRSERDKSASPAKSREKSASPVETRDKSPTEDPEATPLELEKSPSKSVTSDKSSSRSPRKSRKKSPSRSPSREKSPPHERSSSKDDRKKSPSSSRSLSREKSPDAQRSSSEDREKSPSREKSSSREKSPSPAGKRSCSEDREKSPPSKSSSRSLSREKSSSPCGGETPKKSSAKRHNDDDDDSSKEEKRKSRKRTRAELDSKRAAKRESSSSSASSADDEGKKKKNAREEDEEEALAMKKLLRDCDSDKSTYVNSDGSWSDARDNDRKCELTAVDIADMDTDIWYSSPRRKPSSSPRVSNKAKRLKKKQTKKRKLSSSSSDSSSLGDSTTPSSSKELSVRQLSKRQRLSVDDDAAAAAAATTTTKKTANVKKLRHPAFNPWKNKHYKADEKLRTKCRVVLERLPQRVLDRHEKALGRSKLYVENKKFDSIINLDLDPKKKSSSKAAAATASESSDNNGMKNNRTSSRNKKSKRTNDLKSIEDHMVDDGKNVVDEDEEMMSESTDASSKRKVLKVTIKTIGKEAEIKAREALMKDSSSSETETQNMSLDEPAPKANSRRQKKVAVEQPMSLDDDDEDDSAAVMLTAGMSDPEVEEVVAYVEDDGGDEDEAVYDEDDEDGVGGGKDWQNDDVLNFKLSDGEEEEEETTATARRKKKSDDDDDDDDESEENSSPVKAKKKKNKSKKQRKKLVLDSDSNGEQQKSSDDDFQISEAEEEEEEEVKKKKKGGRKRRGNKQQSSDSDTSSSDKRPKSKRKRIKKVASDSDSDADSPSKGRKNIRKVLKDKHVADDTKKAAQDEEERLKRIAERQRLFNEMYDQRLASEAKVDKLVLDIDEETKEELVVVDPELVKRLKPHQAQGIKFMWDACFESLKQIEKSEGSGCIIAHCMGLGKTFQVVTLVHTLLCHEETGVRTAMIVCPLSTVLNWVNEFHMWLKHTKDGDEIEIYELTKNKKNVERKCQLESWQRTGGVLIIGYEMFRNLTSTGKKLKKSMQESINRCLVDPGANLVVCDEGHLLKNEDSALSKAMKLVKTFRRIVLTGTPLQNNLKEYHCMVQFVKPNLLGTKKEFLNRFVNPITNGQFDDSTPYDVKVMKKRAHVLHKMLEGSVQRFDYSVLTPFLPPKQEYVIFVRLSEVQISLYRYYLENLARRTGGRNGTLFADFQALQRIWTHPFVLRLNAEKVEKANEKKRLEASDSEGSLKDFIDDESDSDEEPSYHSESSDDNSDVECLDSDKEKFKRSTRLNPKAEEPEVVPNEPAEEQQQAWWTQFVQDDHFKDLRLSSKLLLLFGILKESEQIGDKVLVFSQSLYSLTLIEHFLSLIDNETQEGNDDPDFLDHHSGNWSLGLDYFRLDGSTSAENRSAWCKIFNNPKNTRARLFLISTRAGGLGINLTAANRVIIFDASWNPSHDVQSIFRIYRFGQKKPCYVYRFLAAGTMEEKIYNRQVTKLSLSCRVVDEQQIERHYTNSDLAELYQFESYLGQSQTLNLPKDRLLAEIFLKHKDFVWNYHEHDSLLENKQEEELDEEERQQAWQEYEDEKQGKRQMMNVGVNMNAGGMNNLLLNHMLANMNSFPEFGAMKELLQKDYPNLTPLQLEQAARQAMLDMYRMVDQQAINHTLNFAGPQHMYQQPATIQQQIHDQQNAMMSMAMNRNQINPLNQLHQMQQMNYMGVNQMPVYSGRGRPPKHMTHQMFNARQQPMPVSTQGHLSQLLMGHQPNNTIEIIDDDPLILPNAGTASTENNK